MEDSCNIEHFSHEHPLSFFQLGEFDDLKPHICTLCQLPILSSPSYTCTIDPNCNFFLHKSCTQFPKELDHEAHCDTLILEQLRPDDSSSQNYFTYRCQNYSSCEFELHPLVAKPMVIASKHMSHKSHPLVACCKKIVSQCDACGEEEKGFFFHCEECNFWIHQDCTILPTIVNLLDQPHPFVLSYSLPFKVVEDGDTCYICSKVWHLRNNGVYFSETYQFAHVSCAKSKMMKNLHIEIIQVPDEEEDTYPSLVIRTFLQTNPQSSSYHHKHPLIQIEHGMKGELDEVCDVCIQPIDNNVSSPFYTCQLSEGCNFVAHLICATNLPTKIQLTIGWEHVEVILCDSNKEFLNSVSPCVFCLRPSNGFAYVYEEVDEALIICDVECALAPKIIKHASHRQHLLFQTDPLGATYSQPRCCSRESSYFNIYRCLACNFGIHVKCALLPKNTRHKFDHHPLVLITDDSTNEDNELKVCFCEVCEQEIELKLWYYGCHECDQYFHIDCIPSVGFLSKVKFGKTHDDRKLHQHPLTLTRMLTHQRNERCGVCKKIIKGFSDDQMAFHCSTCHFWIHFSCASAPTGLRDYSEVLQQLLLDYYITNLSYKIPIRHKF